MTTPKTMPGDLLYRDPDNGPLHYNISFCGEDGCHVEGRIFTPSELLEFTRMVLEMGREKNWASPNLADEYESAEEILAELQGENGKRTK